MSSTTTRWNRPTLAILGTTVLWGTFWIPLRYADAGAANSFWVVGAGFYLPAGLLLLFRWRSCLNLLASNPRVWGLGIAFGLAFGFYCEGALRGEIARVILLFYLTPVWSTLLAWWFLDEPVTRQRVVVLVVGLAGMAVILGATDGVFPMPRTLTDWLGLLAGIAWGVTLVFIKRTREQPMIDLGTIIFIGLTAVFALLTLIPDGRHWSLAEFPDTTTIGWVMALAVFWNLPAIFLTLYGAIEIEPGKVAILLMLEVVIGIAAAALLTDEPFGLREALGAVLIIAAGIIEFLPWPMRR